MSLPPVAENICAKSVSRLMHSDTLELVVRHLAMAQRQQQVGRASIEKTMRFADIES